MEITFDVLIHVLIFVVPTVAIVGAFVCVCGVIGRIFRIENVLGRILLLGAACHPILLVAYVFWDKTKLSFPAGILAFGISSLIGSGIFLTFWYLDRITTKKSALFCIRTGVTLFLSICTLMILYSQWQRCIRFYVTETSREFYRLLEESEQTVLDLRKFRVGEWDEIVFLSSYDSICNHDIDGYPQNSDDCDWNDEGQNHLALIKDNKLVDKIPLNVRKINLNTAGIKDRISRNLAVFEFRSKGDYPQIKEIQGLDSVCRVPGSRGRRVSPASVTGRVYRIGKSEFTMKVGSGAVVKVRVENPTQTKVFNQYGGAFTFEEIESGDLIQVWSKNCAPPVKGFIEAQAIVFTK